MAFDYDFVVIGSGFGGSVSALRLTEKGYKVAVLERGKRYRTSEFARTNWDLRRYLWMPMLRCFGVQSMTLFKNVMILGGTGVGGGSLVYANTLLQPSDAFYEASTWRDLADWKTELAPCYATARRMLGATPNPNVTDADKKLREVAAEMGRGSMFHSVDVGVFFGQPGEQGKTVPDPYFGGAGPERAGCKLCGACMVGCNHNAKNTLDKNYLFFAEKSGCEIIPETNACDIRPIGGDDGAKGYEIHVERSTAWFAKQRRVITARGVVLSAGVIGTVNLLLRCRDVTASLPALSTRLGEAVRTNCETILAVTTRESDADFSHGIALTSGFYADDVTHVEAVRYPKGSSFMKLLAVPMTDDGSLLTRPLKLLAAIAAHPVDALRLLCNRRWAEKSVVLLVMQKLDNKMSLLLGRNLFTFFQKRLTTHVEADQRVPSFIAMGQTVARALAQKINGVPQNMANEVMLQIPSTAHILGGCGIGADREHGVIDKNHAVFGYRNMYVCDGSVIPANLGVNPSLTITAMAERCLGKIPANEKTAAA
jgi:cholesterol oxidase